MRRHARSTRRPPSSTASFEKLAGGTWTADNWRVSSLTQVSSGDLIPIPRPVPRSSMAARRRISPLCAAFADLKARGFRVVFYPFLLMTCAGLPWRGRITYSSDLSSAATGAVNSFLGAATTVGVHARCGQSHRRLCGRADGLHLPAHDPALCEFGHARRRGRSLSARLGTARPRNPPRARPGPRPAPPAAMAASRGTIRSSLGSCNSPMTCAASSMPPV